jgi:hypothetical protein
VLRFQGVIATVRRVCRVVRGDLGECVELRSQSEVFRCQRPLRVCRKKTCHLVPSDIDVWVMIGDFGCCTDSYDKSQGLVEVIEYELSPYRDTVKRPLWMIRQKAGYLVCADIRGHAPTIASDPRVVPEDDHTRSSETVFSKCPRTETTGHP